MPINTLDLHGCSIEEAENRVNEFIQHAIAISRFD